MTQHLTARILLTWATVAPLWAQTAPSGEDEVVLVITECWLEIEKFTVLSPRIANQEPIATVATPVSALRYEPAVDLQARNFAEGQADIAIRGGVFSNTGFSLAGLPLYDPQTGHYYAEIPVAPGMLAPPQVLVGVDVAENGVWNATAGGVDYGWGPVRNGGEVSIGVGEWNSWRTDLLAGANSGGAWAADVGLSFSRSDGPFADADHDIKRFSGRLQHVDTNSVTNLLVGYQDKFFGWPNLYTPFNSPETEDIQTLLMAVTHRRSPPGHEGFVELGAYWRRNDDNYAFNRHAPVPAIPPFKHTTQVVALGGRTRWVVDDSSHLDARLWVLADEIESTSLRFGNFYDRTHVTGGIIYQHRSGPVDVRGGVGYDATDRGDHAFTPVLEVAWGPASRNRRAWSLGYSTASQAPSYTAIAGNPAGGLFRGNPALDRSTSRTLDLTVTRLAGAWTGSLSAFHRWDDELVDWTFRRDFWARSAAAVDVETTGLEAYAHRSWSQLDLHLGYSWLAKTEDYGELPVHGSFYALNFPNHRVTAAMVWQVTTKMDIRLDNEYRVQEPNPLRQNDTQETLLSSIGFYYRPSVAPDLQLSLQIDNLWDSDFEEIPAVPAAPRLLAVGARWRW